MSDQKKKLEEGPPIWVETALTPQEYKETAKKFPNSFTNGNVAPSYIKEKYKGGRWRDSNVWPGKQGNGSTAEEIELRNKELDKLHALLRENYLKQAEN